MRRRPQSRWALLALLGSFGCSATPSAPPLVCDDSKTNEVVFGYQHLADGPGRFDWGQALLVENGSQYLFVDGACQYWAFAPEPYPVGNWGGPRTGVLDASTLEAFNEELLVQPWEDIDEELVRDAPYTHPGLHGIWYAPRWAACAGPCDSASNQLHDAVESAKRWLDRLHASGEPMDVGDRPARIVARPLYGPPEAYQVVPWNGPTPISQLAVPAAEYSLHPKWGDHREITGGDAEEMRRIRDQHTSGELGNFSLQFIVLSGDEGEHFTMWAREELPFEDETGLVRPN